MTEPLTGESILEAVCANVLNARFDDIDHETIDNTKRRVLDMIGCAIGGARGKGNAQMVELVKEWGGKSEASIVARGIKVPVHQAAMVNCVFGRTFDRGPLTLIIDGQRFPTHTSETTVLAALAAGETRGITGKELLTALVAGDDLAARLHVATDRSQPGQVASPGGGRPPVTRGQTDIFGVVAIAGRVLGLSHIQLKHAFGLAVILMGGGGSVAAWDSPARAVASTAEAPRSVWQGVNDPFFAAQIARGGYEETTSVKLVQGLAAERGITAVQLARAGWTGIKDPFFSERGGYYPGIASCNHPERVTAGLGKRFHVEQVFKPYPGGKPTHAPTDAALAIARKYAFNVEDIEEAVLHLSPRATAVHYAKPYMVGDYPTMNALWSYYFAVASALVRKSSRNENFTDEFILDPQVQRLIPKVKLADLDRPEGVELELRLKDGTRFSEYVRVASGEPSNPMTDDDLIAKFMEQVDFSQSVSKVDAERLVEMIDRLEEVDDVSDIAKLASGDGLV